VPDGVPVAVAVAVAVDVAVGVPVWHAAPKTSENALAEPVSAAALSLMLITQLPFAFWPSNALNGLFGENVPVGNAVVSVPHWFSTFGNPPSSSRTISARLLLAHPNVDAGTPGRSNAATVVPVGEVIVTRMSPTNE
jgi:hypothetical protein